MSDYRREYGVDDATLAAMTAPEFARLLRGLSKHSRFLTAWNHAPKHVYDPADIAAIKAAARR